MAETVAKNMPVYATYSYMMLLGLVIVLLLFCIWNYVQTYKLQKAIEVVWNNTIGSLDWRLNATGNRK